MAYTTYTYQLHKFFSMCVCFTKSNREISCTGWTTNVVCTAYFLNTVRITFFIISMWIFRIHSCRITTIDIEWSSESLMCWYFLTIETFLANIFPSLFLLTMIVGPFTLVTVNKSFDQQFVNLSFVPVCLTKISSLDFNSVGLALRFLYQHKFSFFLSGSGFVLRHHFVLRHLQYLEQLVTCP